MSTIERETSRGPLRVEWGINRWVQIEVANGGVVQRRVRSRKELQAFLEDLGIPTDEALELAVNEWAARPGTAGLSAADTALGFSRKTGIPGWVFFPLVLINLVVVVWAGVHFWLQPAIAKWRDGPRINKTADRPVALRFVHAYYDIADKRRSFRIVTRLSGGSIDYPSFIEDRRQKLHPVSGPGSCGNEESEPCFSFSVKGDPIPIPADPGYASYGWGTIYVAFRPRGSRPTVWGSPGFSGGGGSCKLSTTCKSNAYVYRVRSARTTARRSPASRGRGLLRSRRWT